MSEANKLQDEPGKEPATDATTKQAPTTEVATHRANLEAATKAEGSTKDEKYRMLRTRFDALKKVSAKLDSSRCETRLATAPCPRHPLLQFSA